MPSSFRPKEVHVPTVHAFFPTTLFAQKVEQSLNPPKQYNAKNQLCTGKGMIKVGNNEEEIAVHCIIACLLSVFVYDVMNVYIGHGHVANAVK